MTGMEHAIEKAVEVISVLSGDSRGRIVAIAEMLVEDGLIAPAATRDEVWRIVAAHDPGDDEIALVRVNRLTDAICDLLGIETEQATTKETQ